MFSVIARRVPPSPVSIEPALLWPIKGKVSVSLIHAPRTALLFKVVQGVGKCIAFQKHLLNAERKRSQRFWLGGAFEVKLTFCREGIEVERPRVPVSPLLHCAR